MELVGNIPSPRPPNKTARDVLELVLAGLRAVGVEDPEALILPTRATRGVVETLRITLPDGGGTYFLDVEPERP